MKICILNNVYKPYDRGGGAERISEIIAEGLESKGHDVFTIAVKPYFSHPEMESPKHYYLSSLFLDLKKIPLPLRLFWHGFDMHNKRNASKVKKILIKEKPDAVITNNLKGLSFLIPKIIKETGIKHIHILHDIQLIHPSGLMFYGKELKINSSLAKMYTNQNIKLFGSPDIVISPSRWLLDLHKQKGFFKKSKKIVLPNPGYLPADIQTNASASQVFRFIYVGQIDAHKGFPLLINAFKKIDEKKAKLLILGSGAQYEKIKDTARKMNNVSVFGFRKNEEVKDYMKKSDCLIVPSTCYENSPTVIYEAAGLKLPVLASRIGGITELVNTLGGYLFEPGSQNDLVKHMNYIINHPEENKKKADTAYEKIQSYSQEKYLEKIINLINS